MDHATALLRAYDTQLRTDAETSSALAVTRLGPLHLARYEGGRGFVTYQDLGRPDAAEVRRLVAGAVDHFRADPSVVRAEWKTRGHDHAPGLHETLLEHGFVPEDPESVMVGDAHALAVEVPLPPGVTLRQITREADVRAMCRMQAEVFGHADDGGARDADEQLRRLAAGEDLELWVAETEDGRVVSAGRLEPVDGTEFAGIWGGCTRKEWRGRGVYRALTAARARSAITRGKRLVHSDSTEYSRPILERYGFLRVTTTTPYEWSRGPGE
ncbi:GNAT family N-acetyltransferase [Streptomyces sp. NPDC002734]|uniref:GNAT family N-acetyltransferase n=1 Tax=Streptomyces sp. NPDC002734 TaxID=3154426 RepID=UPI0033301CF2